MIIAIDTNCILPGKVGGIENYTLGLIEALKLPASPATRLILLTRPENHELFSRYIDQRTTAVLIEREGFNWSGATQASQLLAYQQRKLTVLLREGVELLHCPGNTINPLDPHLPVVLNLHDLQHRHFPEYFTPEELANREKWWVASAHRADAMLAASEYVREDLQTQLGVDRTKVFVAPDAFESAFLQTPAESQLSEVRQRLDLPKTFFLYPAACWPHKNHARLIRAFAAADLPDAQLILTGGGRDQIAKQSIPANVRLLGRVETADLVGLYHLATAMIFPSQHESWSIPIAEAMACGCPVACSNVTSLPEQIGDAGLLFAVDDERQMAQAMRTLAGDASLRKTLAERGRRRIAAFGTESFLGTISAAYHHAARSFYSRKAA
jgi:glycosyltransferase involved in cell wall biosynthesis